MNIEIRDSGRVLVYEGKDYPLPELPDDALVHIWRSESGGVQVFTQQAGTPEEIPARSGFSKIAELELNAEEQARQRNLKAQCCESIDQAADAARQRFVSPGSLIDQEYKEAYNQAKAWLDSGSDPAAVPQSVADEAEVRGLNNADAAQLVVDTGDRWAALLMEIRAMRNRGKAAVNAVADDSDLLSVAQVWIDELVSIRPV